MVKVWDSLPPAHRRPTPETGEHDNQDPYTTTRTYSTIGAGFGPKVKFPPRSSLRVPLQLFLEVIADAVTACYSSWHCYSLLLLALLLGSVTVTLTATTAVDVKLLTLLLLVLLLRLLLLLLLLMLLLLLLLPVLLFLPLSLLLLLLLLCCCWFALIAVAAACCWNGSSWRWW